MDAPRPGRDLAAAIGGSTVSALLVFLIAALAVQIGDEMRLGPAQLGVIVSAYYMSAAVASIPMSRLAEVFGALRVMKFGCLAMGALFLMLATAVHSLVGLAAVVLVAGIVSAGVQPATNLFLIRRIPRRRQGFAFGAKQAAVPVAVSIAGLSVPTVALTLGWRWAPVAAAVLAVAASVLVPRPRRSFAAFRANRPAVAEFDRAERVNLTVLAIGFGLGVSAASAVSAFVVTAAVASGATPTSAGLLAVLGGVVAAGTRLVIGVYSDRRDGGFLIVVAWMLLLGVAGYLVLAASSVLAPILLIPGIVLAFGAGWGWNGLFNFAVARRYQFQAARAAGITSVGGRMGGMLGPLVFGFIVAHTSYTVGWLLIGAMALIAAVIIAFIHRSFEGRPR